MSQQINLLLPDLQPRFDWLALPIVLGAALVGLLLLAALATFMNLQVEGIKPQEGEIHNQLAGLQLQVQSLKAALGARKGDVALERQIEGARDAVAQGQQVLKIVAQGDLSTSSPYSSLLQGFSRQATQGVWLTGFVFAQREVEIHGRLTDPSLLPVYINRLNGEAAFAGRRFAALDMKGVEPSADKRDSAGSAERGKSKLPYTEFVLHTEAEKVPSP